MKILVIGNAEVSGEWLATIRLLKYIKIQNGVYDFYLAGFASQKSFLDSDMFSVINYSKAPSGLSAPLGTLRSFFREVRQMSVLLRECYSNTPFDVVLSTNLVALAAALRVFGKNKTIIHYFHGWRSRYLIDPSKRTLQEWFMFILEKFFIGRSSSLFVPSENTRQQLGSLFIKTKNIIRIPGVIPHRYFEPILKKDVRLVMKYISLDQNKKYILYCGRIAPYKGLEMLVSAFSKIADPDVKLVIASPKENADQAVLDNLKKQIQLLGLFTRVVFVWDIQESLLPALYAASVVCILPSTSENAPLVMYEALSSGTLFVGSRAGDMPEVLRKIHANLVLPQISVSRIHETLLWCLRLDGRSRKDIISKGKQRIYALYLKDSKRILNSFQNACAGYRE
jgi:glycosyltransferase involved in cell wall biosynthesis